MCPTEPKILPVWTFIEKNCQSGFAGCAAAGRTVEEFDVLQGTSRHVDLQQSLIKWACLYRNVFETCIPQMNFFKLPNMFLSSFSNTGGFW